MDVQSDLIESARAYDAEQAKRAREFEAQYERFLGRKVQQLDPVDMAYVRAHLEQWMGSCVFALDAYPSMLFPGGEIPSEYVPLSRRFAMVPK